MRPLVEEHFDIALGEDGKPQIKAKDSGEGVALGEMLGAMQAVPDLATALKPPRGGGARGSHEPSDRDAKDRPRQKVASPFGLR